MNEKNEQKSKKANRYTEEFKKQIVALHDNGKPSKEIMMEYDLARSTLQKWVANYHKTGSFQAKDNRSSEEVELIELRKENKRLKMENDILKQAALIMAKK